MSNANHDPDEQEKAARLDAFFSGKAPDRGSRDLTVGIDDDARLQSQADKLDEALALHLGDLDASEAVTPPVVTAEPIDDTYERIDYAPALTPYDKARTRKTEAEVWRDVCEPGSDEYHRAMADLAEANRALKVEVERATDDGWRKRRAIDIHRAGEGREEYNSSRRKVRPQPNARRQDMTPEERKNHDADMNAKRAWVSKKRKAGWAEDRIAAELQNWWAKRRAKRAGAPG